jgi:hypothetical protein
MTAPTAAVVSPSVASAERGHIVISVESISSWASRSCKAYARATGAITGKRKRGAMDGADVFTNKGMQMPAPSAHDAAPTVVSLPNRVRSVYADSLGGSEKALLHSWMAFGATFAVARGITTWLHRRDSSGGGSGGIVIGGRHLHHYNLGILMLAGVGGVAVHGQEHRRNHPLTAAAFGSGTALIVDELALLIDLSDVYWANDGRRSVDVAVGLIGVGGALLAAIPFWKGAAREVLRTRRGTTSSAGGEP